eukprot:gene1063-858_t
MQMLKKSKSIVFGAGVVGAINVHTDESESKNLLPAEGNVRRVSLMDEHLYSGFQNLQIMKDLNLEANPIHQNPISLGELDLVVTDDDDNTDDELFEMHSSEFVIDDADIMSHSRMVSYDDAYEIASPTTLMHETMPSPMTVIRDTTTNPLHVKTTNPLIKQNSLKSMKPEILHPGHPSLQEPKNVDVDAYITSKVNQGMQYMPIREDEFLSLDLDDNENLMEKFLKENEEGSMFGEFFDLKKIQKFLAKEKFSNGCMYVGVLDSVDMSMYVDYADVEIFVQDLATHLRKREEKVYKKFLNTYDANNKKSKFQPIDQMIEDWARTKTRKGYGNEDFKTKFDKFFKKLASQFIKTFYSDLYSNSKLHKVEYGIMNWSGTPKFLPNKDEKETCLESLMGFETNYNLFTKKGWDHYAKDFELTAREKQCVQDLDSLSNHVNVIFTALSINFMWGNEDGGFAQDDRQVYRRILTNRDRGHKLNALKLGPLNCKTVDDLLNQETGKLRPAINVLSKLNQIKSTKGQLAQIHAAYCLNNLVIQRGMKESHTPGKDADPNAIMGLMIQTILNAPSGTDVLASTVQYIK